MIEFNFLGIVRAFLLLSAVFVFDKKSSHYFSQYGFTHSMSATQASFDLRMVLNEVWATQLYPVVIYFDFKGPVISLWYSWFYGS